MSPDVIGKRTSIMNISVNIPVAGTWPSPEELAARNAVMASLNELGIGTFTGSGGGMGEMDFSYRVTDESAALSAVERVMREKLPTATYRVQVFDE
jgi:hypothetical protein